ncbi:MAG: right-handed parallel beta-helix repeat-containing protein [Anaerolineales bacterium]
MKRNSHLFLLITALIMALMAGAVGPSAVYADDGDGVTEPSGETPVTLEEEAPVSIPEVLEQAPEGTEVIVVNEAGEVLPLATQEASEILTSDNSDPMWCPEAATPGDASCTASFATFQELIDALTADAISGTPVYTGNGYIWVADGYNGNDNAQIEFDGSVLTNIGSNNLTIQGGWSGNNDTNITGISDLDVSLVFANWSGNVSLNDLAISANDGNGFGLFVNSTGDVALDNVSVSSTTANPSGFGDGAVIVTTGNVDIADSEFDDNAGNGLQVASAGTITLDTVSASNNTLTGAYLDNCLYNNTTGLCAGNGLVTITSATGNVFNGNGFIGLSIDAGGGVDMDNTQANNNGLDGSVITSADDNGTGNVSIVDSEFSGNTNAYGLDVYTDGSLSLNNVIANSNGLGTFLDTTAGTGLVSVTDSTFGDSAVTGNDWSGLHIESGSTVTLLNVMASYNGANGTYIEAQGNIDVTNSTFNENVHFNFPQDPGLYAKSYGGNITLTDVIADGNDFGAGVVLNTKDNGVISVFNTAWGAGHFNGNGTFGIQATTEDGDIELINVEGSNNSSKGAYITSYGLGNVSVTDSEFSSNGSYGAVLYSNQGSVFVTDSTFDLNTNSGLVAVSGTGIELVNVTADGNGGDGVEVYSSYTWGCRGANDTPVNIVVNVDGGTFTNNTGYGIFAKPGPQGDMVFVTPSTFGGNGLGDYLTDLSDPEICPPQEEEEQDNPNVVPAPSNPPVEQDCVNFTSTILELENGTWVKVGCPYEGFSNLDSILEGQLPGPLGVGVKFLNGIILSLTDADGNTILNQDGTVTINLLIPEGSRGRTHSVLFWDETLNDGKGGWMKLPPYEAGTSFPLHPENPDDPRLIVSGVQQVDNMVTFTVNFSGTFILTTP